MECILCMRVFIYLTLPPNSLAVISVGGINTKSLGLC